MLTHQDGPTRFTGRVVSLETAADGQPIMKVVTPQMDTLMVYVSQDAGNVPLALNKSYDFVASNPGTGLFVVYRRADIKLAPEAHEGGGTVQALVANGYAYIQQGGSSLRVPAASDVPEGVVTGRLVTNESGEGTFVPH